MANLVKLESEWNGCHCALFCVDYTIPGWVTVSDSDAKIVKAYDGFVDVTKDGIVTPNIYALESFKFLENKKLKELKEYIIQQSKADLAAYLESHPLLWTDGQYYSITQEKQAQLTSTIVCAQADGQPPEWNSTGGVCRKWDAQELTALGVAIKDRVKALVKYQQEMEIMILNAATQEELDAITVDYDTVPAPQLPEVSQ